MKTQPRVFAADFDIFESRLMLLELSPHTAAPYRVTGLAKLSQRAQQCSGEHRKRNKQAQKWTFHTIDVPIPCLFSSQFLKENEHLSVYNAA